MIDFTANASAWKRLLIIMTIAGGALLLAKWNEQPARPIATIAEREAIEARAEAEDAKMDALAAQGKVKIGMTAAQCRAALGEPPSINRTVTSRGVSEQWIYEGISHKTIYLYLDSGILRAIQD